MKTAIKLICFLSLLVIVCSIGQNSYAGRRAWHKRPMSRRIWRRQHGSERYNYTRVNDLNKDGVVDMKDRVMWVNKDKSGSGIIVVNDDNRDIYEVMDLNENGQVTRKEINKFYTTYDLDGNGVLEEAEINAASE